MSELIASINPLLVKPQRRVQHVPTPSRPELRLYVRALTGTEFVELGPRVSKSNGNKETTAVQLEVFVCDVNGLPLLAAGEGIDFMDAIAAADMRALLRAGDEMNAVNDAAVEEERKN